MIETWRKIPRFPRYESSSFGNIRSTTKNQGGVLRPHKDRYGYFVVTLWENGNRHRLKIHRLILEAFRGAAQAGQECRHLDGNKTNNALDNLKWGSTKENQEDRKAHGDAPSGERNGRSKLTAAMVAEIRLLRATRGLRLRELSEKYGVSMAAISLVIKNKRWLAA